MAQLSSQSFPTQFVWVYIWHFFTFYQFPGSWGPWIVVMHEGKMISISPWWKMSFQTITFWRTMTLLQNLPFCCLHFESYSHTQRAFSTSIQRWIDVEKALKNVRIFQRSKRWNFDGRWNIDVDSMSNWHWYFNVFLFGVEKALKIQRRNFYVDSTSKFQRLSKCAHWVLYCTWTNTKY